MGKHDQDELCRCDAYPVAHDPEHGWLPETQLEPARNFQDSSG